MVGVVAGLALALSVASLIEVGIVAARVGVLEARITSLDRSLSLYRGAGH